MSRAGARARILRQVRGALAGRTPVDHPGDLHSSVESPDGSMVPRFRARFEKSGGQTAQFASLEEARRWLDQLVEELGAGATASFGILVPDELRPGLPEAPPHEAALGVSMAYAAASQSGTLVLDARGGRRSQLLPPTHLIWLPASVIVPDMVAALVARRHDLPSALGLHSGPSKSADIGRTVVTGVHGPGRVIAAILCDR